MDDTREQVNIYIETTVKGPKAKEGAYLYIIENFDGDGQPQTAGGFCVQTETENRMVLGALIRAVARVNEPSRIRVFTRCGHVLSALKNDWLRQWEKAGWKNAKGAAVKNADMWKTFRKEIENHTLEATDADHSYRNWMWFELEERMEKRRKNVG